METIQLKVEAGSASLSGIDEAIERLEALDKLQEGLRERSAQPIRIRFVTEGVQDVEKAAQGVTSLRAGIGEMSEALKNAENSLGFTGLANLGEKLEAGLISSGEAANAVTLKLRALREEVMEHDKRTMGSQADWEAMNAQPMLMNNPAVLDKLAARRKAMEENVATNESMKTGLLELQRLEGMLTAMHGQMADAATAAAKGETGLAEGSAASGAALEKQDAIVKGKLLSLGQLETRVLAVATAERDLAKASTESGEAYEGKGIISQRQREGGKTTTRVRTGEGETATYQGTELAYKDRDFLAEYGNELERIKEQFSAKRASVLPGTEEHIELLRQEAAAVRDLVGEMGKQGHAEDELATKAATRAAALDERAAVSEKRNAVREADAEEKAAHKGLMDRAKERLAQIEREGHLEKTLGGDSAAALQLRAQRLRELSEEMKEKGLGNEPTARAVETAAQKAGVDSEAARMRAVEEARADAGKAAQSAEEERRAKVIEQIRIEREEIERTAYAERQLGADAVTSADQRAVGMQRLLDIGKAGGIDESHPVMRSIETERQRAVSDSGAALGKMRAEWEELARNKQIIADFHAEASAQGGDPKSRQESVTSEGKAIVTRYEQETAGLRRVITLREEYDKLGNLVGAKSEATEGDISGTRAARGLIDVGKNFGHNLATVAQWTLATTALFGSIELLKKGGQEILEVDKQTAHLAIVFQGGTAETLALRDSLLQLAEAEGRSGTEAMEAGTRWAKLLATKQEIVEATRVSLVAANVSDMSGGEAAEKMAGIFETYRLQASDLSGVLGELNAISTRYNVTNEELFDGISRAAPLARQAGLSFAELAATIASGVGRTGRSGGEIGNAMARMIAAMENPATQETLSKKFGFEVRNPDGSMKEEGELLRELYVRYNELGDAERQEMLQKLGSRVQASRVQALMDGYVQSQVLAIRAETDLGAAERANQMVRETSISQIASMETALQRLAVAVGDLGITDMFKSMAESIAGAADGLERLTHGGLRAMLSPEGGATWSEELQRERQKDQDIRDYLFHTGKNPDQDWLNREDQKLRGQTQAPESGGMDEDLALAAARSNLEAANGKANLSKTLRDTIESQQPEVAKRSIEMYASVAYGSPSESSAGERRLDAMLEENNYAGIKKELAEREAYWRGQAADAAEQTAKQTQKTIANESEVLNKLNAQISARQQQNLDAGDLTKQRDEAQRQLDELRGQDALDLTNTLSEEDEENGSDKPMSYQDAADRQAAAYKAKFDAMEKTMDAFPSIKGDASEEAKIDRREQLLNQELAILNEQLPAELAKNDAIQDEIEKRKKAIEIEMDGLEIAREFAKIQDEAFGGKRQADLEVQRYRIGGNDTEKLLNEAYGIMGRDLTTQRYTPPTYADRDLYDIRSRQTTGVAGYELTPGKTEWETTHAGGLLDRLDPSGGPRAEAEALELGNRLYTVRNSLEERQAQLSAEIANAKQKENEEAGKSLEMADREDQLRAALLSKYAQTHGVFTSDQFEFLSKDTREAVQRYKPDLLPAGSETGTRALEREQAEITKSLSGITGQIDKTLAGLQRATGPGAAAAQPAQPLQFTAPPIHLEFSSQFKEMTEQIGGVVGARLQAEMSDIRATVSNFINKNSINRTQGGTVSTVM